MRFRIVGTDKHTGEAINTIIEAPDKFAAMRDARSGGVNVAEVIQVEDLPIERVAPAVVQKAPPVYPIQSNQPGAQSPIQPSATPPPPQVIYVVERQVPATIAPAPVQMPAATQQPPPPQVVTHVHISNNSSATSSPVLSSRSRTSGGGGCLSMIALLVVVGAGAYAASIWYSAQQKSDRSVKPTAPASVPTHAKPKRAPATSASPSPPRVEVGSDAERACLDALRRQPDYIALQAEVAELDARVKASRADARHPLLQSLSEQWMDAKNRLSKMESDALATDPAVQAARNRR